MISMRFSPLFQPPLSLTSSANNSRRASTISASSDWGRGAPEGGRLGGMMKKKNGRRVFFFFLCVCVSRQSQFGDPTHTQKRASLSARAAAMRTVGVRTQCRLHVGAPWAGRPHPQPPRAAPARLGECGVTAPPPAESNYRSRSFIQLVAGAAVTLLQRRVDRVPEGMAQQKASMFQLFRFP